ncbi:AGE family epimerase/isomerase [Shewanella surugensis]|uniref:AGE family epimerase/isomerase n=1 Tax=Shewanella surugensis TaxID=212020 RepID=A0ABT0LEG5_9GAMM|nr:AGE family epimerase/isomerase [Shewanella surugensis]MCL1125949.1 AGE family epimerase/isomerase [Shewanella surugensis]
MDKQSPPTYPTFQDPHFLKDHIKQTMAFYHPNCINKDNGFFQNFSTNGYIYNTKDRHLVSSCRFIFNYAMATIEFNQQDYLKVVQHGIDFIETIHKNPKTGGYAWQLSDNNIIDDTNHCYGLAFVLLSHSVALKAGILSSKDIIEQTWQQLEKYFWDEEYGLYRDEYNADFTHLGDYRGQNANMHMCEAMLTAFEVTLDNKFLRRAYLLAHNITVRQAAFSHGLIWEHYTSDWKIDWHYNKDDPKNLYRPWGYQPGHQTEWAKLLCILYRHQPEPWMIERAEFLFNAAVDTAWDHTNGGIFYGFSPNGDICDSDKYFWVQAESFATAALMAITTGKDKYWHWYQKIWAYSWEHMIDHQHGAWYFILDANNNHYNDIKSPAGGKTDYHTMGACYEVIKALQLKEKAS